MIKKLLYCLIILLALGKNLTVLAATIPQGLNTAVAPVASQSPADLHTAFINGFLQVLTKITGNSQIGSNSNIQQQLPQVERYVQKYRYLGNDLQVAFNEHALISLLADAQQPLWLSARPETLIWLSVAGNTPLNISQTTDSNFLILQNSANTRGIPITFPQMNADDQAIWQGKAQGAPFNEETLQKITERYHVPAILYGEMNQQPDQTWKTVWFLAWNGQTWQWQGSNPKVDLALNDGITKLADTMGQALAVNLDQETTTNIWLVLMGVDNLSDYKAVMEELKRCEPVLAAQVTEVGSHGLLLQLTVTGGGEEVLKTALNANPHFASVSQTVEDTQALHYQWKNG